MNPAAPRHLILYIGGRKTEGTALQSIMNRNCAALRGHGIQIPASLCSGNQTQDLALPRYFLGNPEW